MKIKKKIAVWCALFALMVALVPTSSAYAIDVSGVKDVTESQAEEMLDELYVEFNEFHGGVIENCEYYLEYVRVGNNVQYGRIYSNVPIQYSNVEGAYAPTYYSLYTKNTTHYHCYVFDPSDITKNITASKDNSAVLMSTDFESGIGFITYSNHDICNELGEVVREKDRDKYTFNEWCVDAGLSCSASANESGSVIPFWYNSNYIYIVRKWWSGTEDTQWQMTMIYDNDAGSIYPYYTQYDSGGAIGVGSYLVDITPVTVRNFTYDQSGNGWLLKDFNTYDVSSTDTYDNINVLVGGAYEVVYSNCNIYGFSYGAGIWQEESSGYYEPIQPDSGSGGDSSDVGGSGSSGGGTGGGTRPEINVDLGVDLDEITLDEIPEVLKNIKDSVKEFFGLVGVVPLMIGSIFGFLPDWCLWVLGVSFAFVGILLVVKLIRG